MKQPCDTDLLLARAQVIIAILFAVGFFGVLFALMFFAKAMSDTVVTILTGLVSVLGTLLALIMNFFFARQRPQADSIPDPTTTTKTTTTTTTPTPMIVPAGSTVIHAPPPPAAIVPDVSPLAQPQEKPP
jgi:hypothetical protein